MLEFFCKVMLAPCGKYVSFVYFVDSIHCCYVLPFYLTMTTSYMTWFDNRK